ncbi:MAG TPA: GNAT family N-acetyltransferase [Terracidiphilus sp.]|jgi:CelD/BcsL family acetyltransferase involved in cellulose biosynthesis|nr:GNAT family N-acetyltransferase [Terracidiphilus sp.]
MANPSYAVEAISSPENLSGLKEVWTRLSASSKNPSVFSTCEWYSAWYQRLAMGTGSKREPCVLLLKRNGAITGLAPLVCTASTRFGLTTRRIHFASQEQEWDYNDLVLGDDLPGQTDAVINYLSQVPKQWDLIDLRDLRDVDQSISHIEAALHRASLPYRLHYEEEKCPFSPIEGPWAEIMARRSRSTRRAFRKFNERGVEGLSVRIVERPDQEPGLLEKMIAVEAEKHVGGNPTIPFLGKHAAPFHEIFANLGPQQWIVVLLLELKGNLIAWQLCYRCGKSLWGYLTAFDHRYSEFSPGTMLLPAAMDYGFARGFTEFDFMSGEEPYKMRWASGFHKTYRLLIWNRRWLSRLRAHRRLRAIRSVLKGIDDRVGHDSAADDPAN